MTTFFLLLTSPDYVNKSFDGVPLLNRFSEYAHVFIVTMDIRRSFSICGLWFNENLPEQGSGNVFDRLAKRGSCCGNVPANVSRVILKL